MFLQSCQSVLPDNKVGITEQSQEGVILAGPSVTKLFVGNHRIHGQTKIAFSCSDQGRTLENIKTTTNAYLPSMKNFTFQKRSKKMLLHQRVVWDQALHWGEKEKKKIGVDEKKKGNLRGNLGRGEDGGAWRHAFDEGLNGVNR